MASSRFVPPHANAGSLPGVPGAPARAGLAPLSADPGLAGLVPAAGGNGAGASAAPITVGETTGSMAGPGETAGEADVLGTAPADFAAFPGETALDGHGEAEDLPEAGAASGFGTAPAPGEMFAGAGTAPAFAAPDGGNGLSGTSAPYADTAAGFGPLPGAQDGFAGAAAGDPAVTTASFTGFSGSGEIFAPIGHADDCPCGACGAAGDDGAGAAAADGGSTPTPSEGSPTSGFTVSTVATSGDNAIDSLLSNASYGIRWGSGGAVSLTYSFGTSSSVYISGYSEPSNGFGELSDSQKTAVRSALDYWSDVAAITFTEVTDSSTVAGELRFAKSSDPSTAWAYYPSSSAKGGDVWIGPSSSYNNMSEGTYGFQTLLHEIGHALGLNHTHDGTAAASSIDWTGYSVMSYKSYEGAGLTGYTQAYYPTTPMINDIKAIQHLYGANTSHNSGDTTYSWTTGASILETIWDAGGTDTIDWSNQTTDAVINLTSGVWSEIGPSYISSYSQWPYTYEDRTLMIAEDAVIENAVGGSGSDTITGNAADNVLTGGGGTDTLTGGSGGDRFVFSSGFGQDTITDFDVASDTIDLTSYGYGTYAALQNNVTFSQGSGTTVLVIGDDYIFLPGVSAVDLSVSNFFGVVAGATTGDDTLTGTSGDDTIDGLAGNDTVSGAGGNDSLRGGAGNDTLAGDAGNDSLYGDAGEDTLDGGAGDDALRGGSGRDSFVFSAGFGNDTIHDFTSGFDSIDLSALGVGSFADLLSATADVGGNAVITLGGNSITIAGVTKAQLSQGDFVGIAPVGTSGADTLTGWDTDDTIDGLGGNDTLNGGAGADTLNGGAGNDRLDGGAGADSMAGGTGDDTYIVDNVSDTATESSGEGTDTVESSVTFTIGTNVENLTLTGSADIDGSGNSAANILRGNDGANQLTGNGGNDALFGYDGNDTLTGGSSFDSLIGGAGDDTVYGGGGDDWIRGEADNDTLYGEAGNDKIYGEAGNDTLDGGTGSDYLVGGTGDDIYVIDEATDRVIESSDEGTDTVQSSLAFTVLASNVENLTLTGGADIDGTGNALDNVITGNSGANVLTGGDGNDTLIGGEGSDTYIIGDNTDTIVEGTSASGTDTVIASLTYSIASDLGIENLTLGLTGNFNATGNMFDNVITGNSGDNVLTGGAGNDTLSGGAGTDSLIGGTGDDTYVIYDALDTVTENSGEGTDTVQAYRNYTLGSNIENLTLAGASHINGTGNSLDNTIAGNSARNRIDGGTGADTMAGGGDDDTYVVDNAGDVVTEGGNAGNDTVESSITYTLTANVEALKLTGSSDINGIGNNSDNVIQGNSGVNSLAGSAGNDTILGFGGDDFLYGGTGNDMLYGDAGSDTIDGGAGDDLIRGGSGRDTFVLSASFGNDTIHDFVPGFDQIDIQALGITDFSVLMAGTADVVGNAVITIGSDNLTLTGVTKAQLSLTDFVGLNIIGTSGDDTLNGYATDDIIDGLGGNDTINGGAGNDTIDGGAGNDRLIGHTGADAMTGGTGDDTFVVDDVGDTTVENAGEGSDLVESSISWTLGANIENLKLTGFGSTDGNGNSGDNELRGNAANNVLTGNGGSDTIYGFRGDDTLYGGSSADTLYGGLDQDTLYGAGGDDVLEGEEGNDTLYGEAGNDTLSGGDGNDVLNGGTGNDAMSGNAGNDTYIVDSVSDTVTELSGEGTDTVQSSVNYTLSANVENLTLTGSSDLAATGNTGDNFLQGNGGANTLSGDDGSDIIYGYAGNDTLYGGAGADSLYGDAGTDTIDGGAGDDSLRGGAGRDTFVFSSGFGSDTLHDFTVNFDSIDLTSLDVGSFATLLSNTADVSGNAVITLAGDTITINNVTKAQLLETDFIGLSEAATSGDDTLNGLSDADNIDGLAGNDTIYGNGGDDTLAGGDGNDYIDGGSGADAMTGGLGNDTFIVDDAGDTVFEDSGEGTDLVQSSVTWTLDTNVENLTLTGSSSIDGTGHSGNNTIYGNSGNNVLTGNGGSDALYGYGGDDTLNGGSSADTLIGGTGNDTVNGAGGNDWIRGEDGNDILNGQAGRDRIFGEAGNDTITGGDDIDTLTGGTGADTFNFDALSEIGDVITDFEVGASADVLDLGSLLSAVGYGGADALGDSRVRATQSGADTLVEIDTDGGGNYATVATLQNIAAGDLTTDNWLFS